MISPGGKPLETKRPMPTELVCSHLPVDAEVWRDDATVLLTKCLRCHATWKRGDAEPRVILGTLVNDSF